MEKKKKICKHSRSLNGKIEDVQIQHGSHFFVDAYPFLQISRLEKICLTPDHNVRPCGKPEIIFYLDKYTEDEKSWKLQSWSAIA